MLCHTGLLTAGSVRNRSSVLILFASCQQTCMTCTITVCTMKNSWWWTGELSETCRILFQKYIWEISVSSWFCYKNLPLLCLWRPTIRQTTHSTARLGGWVEAQHVKTQCKREQSLSLKETASWLLGTHPIN